MRIAVLFGFLVGLVVVFAIRPDSYMTACKSTSLPSRVECNYPIAKTSKGSYAGRAAALGSE